MNMFNPYSEFRLIQKLNQLETTLYQVKRSLLQWGIALAFILVVSEGLVYSLIHG